MLLKAETYKTTMDIFNKVKNHLLKQGKRSMLGAACQYRGPDGMKCAIGCIIQDKYYNQHLECHSIHGDHVRHAIEKSISRPITVDEFNMLNRLQTLHDTADPNDWSNRLKILEKYLTKKGVFNGSIQRT